jgi:hypothetical protein
VSQYTIYITPIAWREIRDLPGHTYDYGDLDALLEQLSS